MNTSHVNISATIGKPAPDIQVETWVQGEPANFSSLSGRVVLVEVFQLNCPGCFVHALPQARHLHQAYHEQGLTVIGLATAFEDFDKNTLHNLQNFVATGELTGEPLNEPVVAQGPFAMNTRDEIRAAIQDYQSGRMGKLS